MRHIIYHKHSWTSKHGQIQNQNAVEANVGLAFFSAFRPSMDWSLISTFRAKSSTWTLKWLAGTWARTWSVWGSRRRTGLTGVASNMLGPVRSKTTTWICAQSKAAISTQNGFGGPAFFLPPFCVVARLPRKTVSTIANIGWLSKFRRMQTWHKTTPQTKKTGDLHEICWRQMMP